jgi:hypothetical protein
MFLDQRTRAINVAIERAYAGEHLLFLVDSKIEAQLLSQEFIKDGPCGRRVAFGLGSVLFSTEAEDENYDWVFWETLSGEYRIVNATDLTRHYGRGKRCPSWEGCPFTENPQVVYDRKAIEREEARYMAFLSSF